MDEGKMDALKANFDHKFKLESQEKKLVVCFVLLKLAISLFPIVYGFFGDELYYIAMSDNLDFGYVDVPPLVPFLLSIVRFLIGTSFISLHLLPAACGAFIVVITSLMVKRLGGNFNAQLLALTCVTLAPIYLFWESVYTYDVFDTLCWTLVLYLMVSLLKTEGKKYWIFLGIAAGFGLMTKITMFYLCFGIFLALLLTKERKYFLGWQLWIGVIIAFLIFSPYILWQTKEGTPALEYYKNYAFQKPWSATPLEYIKNQIVTMNLLAFPVWLVGLYYFMFNKKGAKFRVLSYAYIVILIICIILKVKFYLIAPFYTILFAGGAVFVEEFAEKHSVNWLKRKLAIVILLAGLIHIPFVRPVLPVDVFMKYTGRDAYMGVRSGQHKYGSLPPHFADRFGWEEMAASVAKVYNTLTKEEKAKVCVLTGNYEEAGAIWVLGGKYNLPKPISGHLQYFIWGPRDYSGEIVISLGIPLTNLENLFHEIKNVGKTECALALPCENNLPIYLCKKPEKPLKEMWAFFKHFD